MAKKVRLLGFAIPMWLLVLVVVGWVVPIAFLNAPMTLTDPPKTLWNKLTSGAAFVGVAAGRWGGLRPVEQLEMIFQYRNAHLFGRRLFIPSVHGAFDAEGRLVDAELGARLEAMVRGFSGFCRSLCSHQG